MVIVSLLGLSVYSEPSSYTNNTDFKLKSGDFINSIDVLLNSYNSGEKFIFFGTKKSIQKHKDAFDNIMLNKNIDFIEYENGNLNDIFSKMISKISTIKDEILFDITHSFRDAVIMNVISTLISQIVYTTNITMIYAKEIREDKKVHYRYEPVGDDILNSSNIAFVLSTFLKTLKTPPLKSKYELYDKLNNFSIHLLSNQFKAIYEEDINSLKEFIKNNRDRLFFVKDLINQLEQVVLDIEQTKNQQTYKKFLFFAEFFHKKDYYLHSATYLIEGLTQYIGVALKEQHYITFNVYKYENQQKIVSLLKLNYNPKDYTFPNEYFVDINIDIFNKLDRLRDRIALIRHNLAHINIQQDYLTIKEDLKYLLEEYKEIINSRILYKLDRTLSKKTQTVKYTLQQYDEEIKKFLLNKNSPVPKLKKVIEKYKDKTIDSLTMLDTKRVKTYLDNNISEIEKILIKQQNRELLLK